MDSDARNLIAQHAETARLLGVDFLPLGTAPAIEISRETPVSQAVSDAVTEEAPRFADRGSQRVSTQSAASAPSQSTIDEIRAAYESASDAQAKLDALRAKYEADAPHASFAQGFKNIVFGEGAPDARLMFIGEAPGQQEDETGRPFIGRAGQLLEKMIVAMGYSRESVYICNVLKTRPPNNATPTSAESEACAPYLYEQIRIVNPEAIVTLGLPATRTLLQQEGAMRNLRGRWHAFPVPAIAALGGLPEIPVMPTYHPAYLLRSYTEENRRKVWSDLQMVQTRLSGDE